LGLANSSFPFYRLLRLGVWGMKMSHECGAM
jgi:hypothetical protein